jgi:hypothetical protein
MSKYTERSCNDDYSPHLYKEVRIVKCFNDFHKTNFRKQEIDHIYWLTDIYKVQVPVAIKYSQECHMCGTKLTDLDEFCCDAHREIFDSKKCFWGEKCELCIAKKKMDAEAEHEDEHEDEDEEYIEETFTEDDP